MDSVARPANLPTPGSAYWNQRLTIGGIRNRILDLSKAVDSTRDLHPTQWAQLLSFALEYKPDIILELGRGNGNSTCTFNEAANILKAQNHTCLVHSICDSNGWGTVVEARVRKIVPARWFDSLIIEEGDILNYDYEHILQNCGRCLVFWDAHGFEIAECVLGRILPLIVDRQHIVIMHDLSDSRYMSEDSRLYGDYGLWKFNNWSGPRLRLGHIDTAVEQAIAIVDFTSRNGVELHSADKSIHTAIGADQCKMDEMREVLSKDLFSLSAHWFYFSLNEASTAITFPKFFVPNHGQDNVDNQSSMANFDLRNRHKGILSTLRDYLKRPNH